MASGWFYQAMGKQIGPISGAQLRDLAQRGAISPDTLVRKAPGSNWVLAERVRGLFSVSNPSPTSPVGPTPKPATGANARDNGDVVKWLRAMKDAVLISLLVAVVSASLVVLNGIANEPDKCGGYLFFVIPLFAVCVFVGALVYLLPTIVAKRHNHPHYAGILTLNLGLGWTFLGWLGALVWARMIREGGNCWRCNARLNGFPLVCQFCQAELTWEQGKARAP
jgi:hypothetical protein